jgi:hypothetical protein
MLYVINAMSVAYRLVLRSRVGETGFEPVALFRGCVFDLICWMPWWTASELNRDCLLATMRWPV